MRDQRDPSELGRAYLSLRENKVPIEFAVGVGVAPYQDGGHISSNPADHHSKTPQVLGDLSDGGEA